MTQIKLNFCRALARVGPVGVRIGGKGRVLVACTIPGVPSGEVLLWRGWLASERAPTLGGFPPCLVLQLS